METLVPYLPFVGCLAILWACRRGMSPGRRHQAAESGHPDAREEVGALAAEIASLREELSLLKAERHSKLKEPADV